jgi:hypothetical protein
MAMERITVGIVFAVAAVGLVVGVLVSALLVANRTVPNSGSVKAVGVGVYWNSACTNETTSINWGFLDPNTTRSYTVYIKNNGTIPVTLSVATSNWNPSSASTYLALNWNCTSYRLANGGVVTGVLALTISPNINGITSFGFDVTIIGTESP